MSSKYGFDRRQWVRSAVAGSMVLPALVERLMAQSGDPLAPKESHFPAKAKNVIFLFMTGGVSHVDTWDPKPELISGHGKEIKADHPEIKDRPGYERIFLKKPQWEFRKHGECGTEVSSLFPHMATCVDDIALIRSMHTSHSNHYNATLGMHTGSFAQSRPSMGAWVTYGLGTLNRNLPGFVVIAPRQTYAGTQVYSSDFLPGLIKAPWWSRVQNQSQTLHRAYRKIGNLWNWSFSRRAIASICNHDREMGCWNLECRVLKRLSVCRWRSLTRLILAMSLKRHWKVMVCKEMLQPDLRGSVLSPEG